MHKIRLVVLALAVNFVTSCQDYDISEVVDDSYTFTRDSIMPSLLPIDADSEMIFFNPTKLASMGNSTSPMHAPGQRNASTAWFFNQPWAARVIWGKMLRDTILLLVISSVLVFLSRQKEK